jgi:hypothetical protein
MAEYRALRERVPFLTLCKTPTLAAQVTVEAVERLGVDAAIIFADFLLIVEPMDVGLECSKGDGPVIHRPVRSGDDVDKLREDDPRATVPFVFEAVKKAQESLPAYSIDRLLRRAVHRSVVYDRKWKIASGRAAGHAARIHRRSSCRFEHRRPAAGWRRRSGSQSGG